MLNMGLDPVSALPSRHPAFGGQKGFTNVQLERTAACPQVLRCLHDERVNNRTLPGIQRWCPGMCWPSQTKAFLLKSKRSCQKLCTKSLFPFLLKHILYTCSIQSAEKKQCILLQYLQVPHSSGGGGAATLQHIWHLQ